MVRATLSQLRSGFCARLKDYQLRIGKAVDDLCPECNAASHTTSHIFVCPSHPTPLTVESLWSDPWGVANFLPQLTSFQFLPVVGPPPLRNRRRARPPADPPPVFSPASLPPSPFLFTPPPLTPPVSPGQNLPPPLMQQNIRPLYSSISSFSFASSSPPSSPRSQDPSYAGSDSEDEN